MLTEGHYRKLIERPQGGWPTPPHVRCACWSAPGWRRTGSRKGNVRLGGSARHRRCRALASDAAAQGIMLAPGAIFRPQQQPRPSCASTPPMRSTNGWSAISLKRCRASSAADCRSARFLDQAAKRSAGWAARCCGRGARRWRSARPTPAPAAASPATTHLRCTAAWSATPYGEVAAVSRQKGARIDQRRGWRDILVLSRGM